MSETIWEASGGRYKFNVGTSPDINYFSNGGSDDWVRGENLFTNFCFLSFLSSSLHEHPRIGTEFVVAIIANAGF